MCTSNLLLLFLQQDCIFGSLLASGHAHTRHSPDALHKCSGAQKLKQIATKYKLILILKQQHLTPPETLTIHQRPVMGIKIHDL